MKEKVTPKVEALLLEMRTLSFEELRALNAGFVAIYKNKQHQSLLKAAEKLIPGQLVKFEGSKGRHRGHTIYMRISHFNRAGTCAVGPQCNEDGSELPFSTKWTVANSMLTVVSEK